MPGRKRARKVWKATRPAARGQRTPRNCSGATAVVGGNSVSGMTPSDHRRIIAVSDAVALAEAAAERIMARIATNGERVAICLTGGSSPKELYQLLATDAYRS